MSRGKQRPVRARSDAEVKARGVQNLDPVSFKPELVLLANDQWAGPALGQKAVCAALLEAGLRSSREEPQLSTHLVWMAKTRPFPPSAPGAVGVKGRGIAIR